MKETARGRPIRFFTLLMIGWTAIRFASPTIMTRAFPPIPRSDAPPTITSKLATLVKTHTRLHPSSGLPRKDALLPAPFFVPLSVGSRPVQPVPRPPTTPEEIPLDLLKFVHVTVAFAHSHFANAAAMQARFMPPLPLPSPLALSAQRTSDRWQGSSWVLWRDGSGTKADAAAAGRLGGSQAGIRLDIDLTPSAHSRTAAYTRITSALQRPAAPEAAIGLAFQPVRTIAISVAAERRISLGKGARNANTVMAVGGFGPTYLTPAIQAEGYAQAGMVGFRSRDAFIDGKFSLFSPLSGTPIRIGASLSGGAQPQVERLDIGPELQVRLPLPQIATRVSLEWRQRIAGNAAPASGLAITLAADF